MMIISLFSVHSLRCRFARGAPVRVSDAVKGLASQRATGTYPGSPHGNPGRP